MGLPLFGQTTFVNFEAKQTAPVRLSPDGSRLFAVNTPDARLSVFDVSNPKNPILMAEIPVGIEPVSVQPVSNEEAWVINEVSDSISVVNVPNRLVTDTIYVKDEPADIVFANGRAFVTGSRNNQIIVIDPVSHVVVTNISVFGENPRALAVSADQTRVFAAFALSGNRTTILPADKAPVQPPPTNPNLPPGPQVGLIIDATDPLYSIGTDAAIKYTMPDQDVVEINTSTLGIVRYFSRVGTVNLGIAVHPVSGDLWVANTDARNLVRFEPVLRGNFMSNRVSRIQRASGVITHFDLNPGFTYTGFPNSSERSAAMSQPTALAFTPDGSSLFVTSFGTDRIALLDGVSGQVLARLDLNPEALGATANPKTKRGPRGLALKPGHALYVLNRLANTIAVVDPADFSMVRELPVGGYDPTPAFIREGRGFLYDAKLSGSGTLSCASCHIDSDMDFVAWDLGDPGGERITNQVILPPLTISFPSVAHPMKGPMTTQTLRGLKGLDPLHWRGDRTNFLHFNGAFDSLLGGSILAPDDMMSYRTFIHSIQFEPNPNQNIDRSFPTSFPTRNGIGNAAAGRNTFINEFYTGQLTCNTCHTLPTGTVRIIIPAAALDESQDFKVPHLRNVYQKLNVDFSSGAQSRSGYGIIHDGIDPDLFTFLSRDVFDRFSNDTVRKRNLDAFVQCFDTGTAPAVGYTRTITQANAATAKVTQDWTLLEAQAAAGNIDLIVKGTLDRQTHGLIYDLASNKYQADTESLGPYTRTQLLDQIQAGDTLSIMGVPPGTGMRMAVDRDENEILDGDEPNPTLHIARGPGPGQALISWTTNAAAFVLEQTPSLPAAVWTTETSPRGVVSGQFNVTNSIAPGNRIYRLRGL